MHHRTPDWLLEVAHNARFILKTAEGRTRADYHADEALRSIIGLRNLLAHAYADVDVDRMWTFVESFVPQLIDDVDRLLSDT